MSKTDISVPLKRKKLWQHSFFLILVPLIAAIFTVLGYLFWFRHIREIPPAPDVKGIRPVLQNGDVILRSGIGFWSGIFRSGNTVDKRFSHVGIVRIRPDGVCRVIHAEGDDATGSGFVFEDSLEHFVGESDGVGVSRLRKGDPDRFADAAMTFLGRPFDWKFDKNDDSSIYCTELIDLCLQKLNPPIRLKEHKNLFLPESCLDPEIFVEISVLK